MSETVIKCESVYKIFGENAKKMLEEANGNVDAKTFQEKGCIVGVNNASFEVAKGEMLVVMGLSGSGKSTLLRCISRLTDDVYEKVCKATKLIPQRAIMGANFLNFRAHELYTINGNKIDETFVKWDQEKGKCFAGFTVSGNNVGVDESITIIGEALSFLSTGIDTRVYFIKNF